MEKPTLGFLASFIKNVLHYTQKDFATAAGIAKATFSHYVQQDDIKLSKLQELLNSIGFSLSIDLIEKGHRSTSTVTGPGVRAKKRLHFLSEEISKTGTPIKQLADYLDCSPSAVYYWIRHDDCNLSDAIRIASFFESKLKITISNRALDSETWIEYLTTFLPEEKNDE